MVSWRERERKLRGTDGRKDIMDIIYRTEDGGLRMRTILSAGEELRLKATKTEASM